MTDTATVTSPVTVHDTRALRNADSVSFHLYEGQSVIRATKRAENSADGFEQTHMIYCAGAMRDFEPDGSAYPVDLSRYAAYDSSLSAKFDPDLQTLITRIRPGDTLTLAWTRSNNNENQRGVGWGRDELRLVITNPKGKTESYLVAVYVGPDNSARMIRLAN